MVICNYEMCTARARGWGYARHVCLVQQRNLALHSRQCFGIVSKCRSGVMGPVILADQPRRSMHVMSLRSCLAPHSSDGDLTAHCKPSVLDQTPSTYMFLLVYPLQQFFSFCGIGSLYCFVYQFSALAFQHTRLASKRRPSKF